MGIAKIIINWYSDHQRILPWRAVTTPYHIWISEIILQQTRVDQGLPYYLRFLEKFPTIKLLAEASEKELMVVWQGLGYYSRARNMHFTAKYIVENLNSKFPTSAHELLKLKGIGEYSAAAIASICFSENIAAIDGNVNRVISRLFDINLPVDTQSGKNEIKQISASLIRNIDSGVYNQAIMDFGAMQCIPKKPDCSKCPLIDKCLAYQNNTVLQRPVKSKKTKQRDRFFTYIVIYNNHSTLIKKRTHSDIWKGLFEFPMLETDQDTDLNRLNNNPAFSELVKNINIEYLEIKPAKVHILTHQRLYTNFILLKGEWDSPDPYLEIPLNDLSKYAFPVLLKQIVQLLISLQI